MPTSSSSSSARSPGRRAILLMIGAAGCFASNDALVKFVSQSLAPAQVILLRSVIASMLILLVARRAGATPHLAAAVSPRPDLLADERAEHVLLFNLLGDPTLRMPLPEPIALKVAKDGIAGATLLVEGTTQLAGTATIDQMIDFLFRALEPRQAK